MKNGLSKLAKDKLILGAMLFCVVLATMAAVLSYYNRQRHENENDYVALEDTTAEQVADNETEKDERTTHAFESTSDDTLVKNDQEKEKKPVAQGGEGTSGVGSGLLVEIDNVATSAEVLAPVDATASEEITVPAPPASTQQEVAATVEETTTTVNVAANLNFAEDSTMGWPVQGEVIREFSMDTTVWFPTLEQYKTSNAIQIQSEVGTPVTSAVDAQVLEVGQSDEIGNYVMVDLGNGYRATYGNLQDITVMQGQYLSAGEQIGVVSQPTRYYTVDGSHLYFQMSHDETYLDPLDYIR